MHNAVRPLNLSLYAFQRRCRCSSFPLSMKNMLKSLIEDLQIIRGLDAMLLPLRHFPLNRLFGLEEENGLITFEKIRKTGCEVHQDDRYLIMTCTGHVKPSTPPSWHTFHEWHHKTGRK